jgi:alkylation response protein AidB-like acyl-CoA dehydrogenase
MTPGGRGFNGPTKPAMEQYSGSKRSAFFTDDQLAIRDLTRRFVRSEILPNILQWDEEEAVPGHVWKRIGELGLHGVCAPAEWAVLTVGLSHGP